jgi:hypothetical protein
MRRKTKTGKEKVSFNFDFQKDAVMGEVGASTAEGDTEDEQIQGAEEEGDSVMDDWNEGEHAPNIRKEVDAAWNKLSQTAKNKNIKSESVSKNVEARKQKAGEHGGAPQEQIARESVGAGRQEKAGACPTEKGGDAEGSKGTRRTCDRSDDRHGQEDVGLATGVRNCAGQEICG